LLLTTKSLVSHSGINVVGFCPEITQNDTILSAILSKRGITGIGKQEEACKVNRKWWASFANSPTNLDHSATYMFQNGRYVAATISKNK